MQISPFGAYFVDFFLKESTIPENQILLFMINLTILTRLSGTDPKKVLIKTLVKGVAIPNFVPLGDSADKICAAVRGTAPDIVIIHDTSEKAANCLHDQMSQRLKSDLPIVLAVDTKGSPEKIKKEHRFPSWEAVVPSLPHLMKIK